MKWDIAWDLILESPTGAGKLGPRPKELEMRERRFYCQEIDLAVQRAPVLILLNITIVR